IARRYRTTVATLAKLNHLDPRRYLLVGTKLKLPAAAGSMVPASSTVAGVTGVRASIDRWAAHFGVSPHLARALAWMESGYQPGLVSPSGARGVMQVLPSTRRYVERVLLGRRAPTSVSGGIQVGVVYFRELLREFHGSESLALAAWYQGPASVRQNGVAAGTHTFVANVLALRRRGV
ncbi:MAG: lytic transglycosylase domain-containing protein, partial [Gaiellaceae bacterium]